MMVDMFPQVGGPMPDITLPHLDGGELSLHELRGTRRLLFFWGSWWGCREQLPGWQQFVEAHRDADFELIGIALEHTGADAARPFVEQAGIGFPMLVDEHGLTSSRLGFKAVPNGILVDEQGTIRWTKYGGFSVDKPEDVAVVERFLGGEDPGPSRESSAPYVLGTVERELVATTLRLGRLLDALGRRDEAVTEWQAALRLDPGNLVIRKQLWAARYPEKFHPVIDWAWQTEQLERERREEMAAGICGPDGCPIPPR